MIKLKVDRAKSERNCGFSITSNEPVTITVGVIDGRPIAHVYRGDKVTEEDEPIGCFDAAGMAVSENRDWSSPKK